MKRATTVDANEAKTELIQAVRDARDETSQLNKRTGPVYGNVVRGVIKCMDAALTRQQISTTISQAWSGGDKQASKGIGARYIILARYQRKEWLDTEKHVRSAITVNGSDYPSPLDALDSGESFTSVYQAWTSAVKQRVASEAAPQSPIVAARRLVAKMFVVVSQDGATERLKVEEDPRAFAGVMGALMATMPAVTLLPPRTRHSVIQALKRAKKAA